MQSIAGACIGCELLLPCGCTMVGVREKHRWQGTNGDWATTGYKSKLHALCWTTVAYYKYYTKVAV